jgi:hypothetical protein
MQFSKEIISLNVIYKVIKKCQSVEIYETFFDDLLKKHQAPASKKHQEESIKNCEKVYYFSGGSMRHSIIPAATRKTHIQHW